MRLDFSNNAQFFTFLGGVVMGVCFCIVYDFLRFFKKKHRPSAVAEFAMDVLFWCFASVATFCFFILFSKGMIRGYVYVAEALGFLICRLTLSRLFLRLLKLLDRLLLRLLKFLLSPLKIFAGFVKLRVIFPLQTKVEAILAKIFKNIKKTEKNI